MSVLDSAFVRRPLSKVKWGVYAATARALATVLGAFPRPVGAQAKQRAAATALLDFPEPIRMTADSPIELARLNACRKEPETVAWLRAQMAAGDVLYDVGANVGAYSLVADRCARGRGRVVAFEPSATTFALLMRNVFLNAAATRITPLFVALSDVTGLGSMALRSLEPGEASHAMDGPEGAAAGAGAHGGTAEGIHQPVGFVRLDELIAQYDLPSPTLMKIDVDGGELSVLRGAERTLQAPSLRSILIEIDTVDPQAEATLALLAGHGFAVTERHVHGTAALGVTNFILTRGPAPLSRDGA